MASPAGTYASSKEAALQDPVHNSTLRPLWAAGLDGRGQLIGIADTGIDMDRWVGGEGGTCARFSDGGCLRCSHAMRHLLQLILVCNRSLGVHEQSWRWH